MFKGLVKDDKTLRELKVTKGAKFMLVGSKLDDVLEVNKPVDKKALAEEEKKGLELLLRNWKSNPLYVAEEHLPIHPTLCPLILPTHPTNCPVILQPQIANPFTRR